MKTNKITIALLSILTVFTLFSCEDPTITPLSQITSLEVEKTVDIDTINEYSIRDNSLVIQTIIDYNTNFKTISYFRGSESPYHVEYYKDNILDSIVGYGRNYMKGPNWDENNDSTWIAVLDGTVYRYSLFRCDTEPQMAVNVLSGEIMYGLKGVDYREDMWQYCDSCETTGVYQDTLSSCGGDLIYTHMGDVTYGFRYQFAEHKREAFLEVGR